MSSHVQYDTPVLYDMFYRAMLPLCNGPIQTDECATAALQSLGLIDETGDYGEAAFIEVVKL